MEVRQAERQRVAVELHDELGQALTAIKINLYSRELLQGKSPADLNAENLRIVEESLQQVRRMPLALRPSVLDDLGLAPALRWLGDQSVEYNGFTANFYSELPLGRLEPEIETAFFSHCTNWTNQCSPACSGKHCQVGAVSRGRDPARRWHWF